MNTTMNTTMNTETFRISAKEIGSLDEKYGYEAVNAGIVYAIREDRGEEWKLLNEGLSDCAIVEGIAALHQG